MISPRNPHSIDHLETFFLKQVCNTDLNVRISSVQDPSEYFSYYRICDFAIKFFLPTRSSSDRLGIPLKSKRRKATRLNQSVFIPIILGWAMSVTNVLLVPVILVPILIVVMYFLVQGQNLGTHAKLFIYGGLGWTIAFVIRLLPLQIVQLIALVAMGADLTDPDSLTNVGVMATIVLAFIGSLFAGVFEEPTRYFILYRVPFAQSPQNRMKSAISFGIGWSAFEIILVNLLGYVNLLVAAPDTQIDLIDLLPNFFERSIVTVFHVSMTMMIIYAIFERPMSRKTSLWMAIFLHFLLDFVAAGIIVPIVGSSIEDPLVAVWVIEGLLAVVILLIYLFVYRYWVPQKEAIYGEYDPQPQPTGYTPLSKEGSNL